MAITDLLGQINQASGFGSTPTKVTNGVSDPYNIMGGGSSSATSNPSAAQDAAFNNYAQQQAAATSKLTAAIYAQINQAGTPNTSFNINNAYQQAAQQSQQQASAMYQPMIAQFNAGVDAMNQSANAQQQLSVAGLQEGLQNLTQQNTISGQRVGEDTSTALGNLANAQQNYKQTEGLNFDQAQRALGTQEGAAGTATSGVGQQVTQQAQTMEGLVQQAQGQQYQVQRVGQQLFANRSFEDLSRSTAIGGQQEQLGEQQAGVTLNTALAQNAAYRNQNLNNLAIQQQAQQATDQNSDYQNALNAWFSGLKGRPQDLAATAQMYGIR